MPILVLIGLPIALIVILLLKAIVSILDSLCTKLENFHRE